MIEKNRFFITLSISVLLLIGISWYFSTIFVYLIISLVLTTLLRPLVNLIGRFQIMRRKLPRSLAIMCSFAFTIFLIGSFVLLFVPLFSEQIQVISGLNFDKAYDYASQPISTLETFFIDNQVVDQESGFMVDNIKELIMSKVNQINFTQIINDLLSVTGNFFVGLLAVTFISFFLLYESGILRKTIISIIPNQYFEVFIGAMFKTEKLLSNYLLGLFFQMLSIFSIVSIGLGIFGVKYALTIAVFAAFANLIPYLGPILGASFGLLVSLSTYTSIGFDQDAIILMIKILAVFATVQITDNVVLQPLIFSKSVKAHPLEIFIIIFAGAAIGAIPGMVAAIPVYTIIRVTSKEVYAGIKEYRVFQN
ncbi:MAG: AI-2E family transporter [Bacteroidota bacterium]